MALAATRVALQGIGISRRRWRASRPSVAMCSPCPHSQLMEEEHQAPLGEVLRLVVWSVDGLGRCRHHRVALVLALSTLLLLYLNEDTAVHEFTSYKFRRRACPVLV